MGASQSVVRVEDSAVRSNPIGRKIDLRAYVHLGDLSPDDVNFVDNRKGFGWSDRCFTEIKAAKWGWARAACDRGLALPDVDNARPLLQCYLVHDYDPRLNSNHPGRPRGTDYCCPVNDEDECPPCADED